MIIMTDVELWAVSSASARGSEVWKYSDGINYIGKQLEVVCRWGKQRAR